MVEISQTNSEILERFLEGLDHGSSVLDFLVKDLGEGGRARKLHCRDVDGAGRRTWHDETSCQLNLAGDWGSETGCSCTA